MGADGFYSAEQVRELEQRAIRAGIPARTLMRRAAAAAWRELTRTWPDARSIAVVCGSGNNGGDGYDLAGLARAAGWRVEVWEIAVSKSNPATAARRDWLAAGGRVRRWRSGALSGASVIVDAVFGIGLSRPLDGAALTAVQAINQAGIDGAGVLALDIPTGLEANRGAVLGAAVRADCTVTFIARKPGLYTSAGPDHTGRIVLAPLGIAAKVFSGVSAETVALEPARLQASLPQRRRTAHKGHHGHVLIIGGDQGMGGAVLLAARGALRSGAGLVSVATHPAHAPAIMAAQPELMVHAVDDGRALRPLLLRASVVAIGPGLGLSAWARELWPQCLAHEMPTVLDADALNWLADDPQRRADWVLTPHPGEAARLLQSTTAQIQSDRFASLRSLVNNFGGVAVLKGAGTLVGGEGTALCARGSPGMAVGGMGDVLSGVIAALMAQGLEPEPAAQVGVLAHALAGEKAASGGERGTLPGDLIDCLRTVLNP